MRERHLSILRGGKNEEEQQIRELDGPKFRTTEIKELRLVTGGLASDLNTDTITVTPSGSQNDGDRYPIDRGEVDQ